MSCVHQSGSRLSILERWSITRRYTLRYKGFLVVSILALCVLMSGQMRSQEFAFSIPSGEPVLNSASDVAVDWDGNLYVVLRVHELVKVDPTGQEIWRIGTFGSAPGEFWNPDGVAVDSVGNAYVADRGNNRIQIFDTDGNFLRTFGSGCVLGSSIPGCIDPDGPGPLELGDGQFNYAQDVAVDDLGNIYVADHRNHRIQKFDSTGNFILKFGRLGSRFGQFRGPDGLAMDRSRNIYVSESRLARIQKFDATGRFMSSFGSRGVGEGQFDSPEGITLNNEGHIYVADRLRHSNGGRIQKFDAEGNFLLRFGTLGNQNGQFLDPVDVALDSFGNIYVADPSNGRVEKFDPASNYLQSFGTRGNDEGHFDAPLGIAFDALGNIYVADTANHRIQKFDAEGHFLLAFGTFGSDEGEFFRPHDLAVDRLGNVYVWDPHARIQKFSSEGLFLTQFQAEGSSISSLAVDSFGNIYVVTRHSPSVRKFDELGNLLLTFGDLQSPHDIAVDSRDNVYVADTRNARIQMFDTEGNFLFTFNIPSFGITVDLMGNIHVFGAYRVQTFNSNGELVGAFGSRGSHGGQFRGNVDSKIEVDNLGNIAIADSRNHRIQVFSLPPESQLEFMLAHVGVLVERGELLQDRSAGLRAKLDAARRSLGRENTTAAINQLHAFINQVNAFVAARALSRSDGEALIHDANRIVAQMTE